MKKEEIIELLVRKALSSNNVDELNCPKEDSLFDLSNEDWAEVYNELVAQTIEGIPCEWVLEHLSIPDDVRSLWRQNRINQVAKYYRLLQEQNELCQLMKGNGIPTVIMKGTASAMYYPDPSARSMGDIDFLVAQADYERAFRLMKDNGYQLMFKEDHVNYHMTLGKNGFIYEIHRQPAGLPDGVEGDYLLDLIGDGLRKTEEIELESYLIPMLPWMQNGIVLLPHIVKHLRRGLGLRQIIDWMMYVNRELHDDNWHGSMQPILEKVGLETMAKSVTRMCQIYLDLSEKEITWCFDADENVCRDLMSYIMRQGNFGRKVLMEDRGARIVGGVNNPIQFFKLLQEKGLAAWDLVKKYPVLKMWHGYIRFADISKNPCNAKIL